MPGLVVGSSKSFVGESYVGDPDEFTLTPTAIATLEAFGTLVLALAITASGIATAEAFGTASVTVAPPPQTITASGIATAEAFGSARIDHEIAPSAIASLEAVGTLALQVDQTVTCSSIASAEALGTSVLSLSILPSSIASAEAFGTLTLGLFVSPSAIASAELFGSSTVIPGEVFVSPAGIASLEAFGTHALSLTVAPSGISSLEAFGASVLSLYVAPSAIASAEAFGSPELDLVVLPSGVASLEAFGTTEMVPGEVTITAVGIAGAEAYGEPVLSSGAPQDITASAIDSLEAVGEIELVQEGDRTLVASAIASLESFGTNTITREDISAMTVYPTGIDDIDALPIGISQFRGNLAPNLIPAFLLLAIESCDDDGLYGPGTVVSIPTPAIVGTTIVAVSAEVLTILKYADKAAYQAALNADGFVHEDDFMTVSAHLQYGITAPYKARFKRGDNGQYLRIDLRGFQVIYKGTSYRVTLIRSEAP